jgi:hypothetical protein
MTRLAPALIMLIALGSSISSAKPVSNSDPFDSYISSVKSGQLEFHISEFAEECSPELAQALPRFAVNPGTAWTPVKNLGSGVRNLQSDFFSTVEVRRAGNRVLVVIWALSLDVGQETRILRCFDSGTPDRTEIFDWNCPNTGESIPGGWGHKRSWEYSPAGRARLVESKFVNADESPSPTRKISPEDRKWITEPPDLGPLRQLHLPQSLLK